MDQVVGAGVDVVVTAAVVVGAGVVVAAVVVGAIVVAVVVGAVVVVAAVDVGTIVVAAAVVVLFLAPPVVSTTTETDTPTKKITNTVAKMTPPITIGIIFPFLFQLIPDSGAACIPLIRVTDIFKALT